MVFSACEKVPLLAPSGSTLTLISTATALPLNGTSQLIAQLIEPAGTPPHSGTSITFTTSLGSIEPADATTDTAGRAVVTFNAGTLNGTATITAMSGGVSASGNNAIKIAVGTAAVGRVIVSASPTLVPALGGVSTITATVLDLNGNPLNLAPVAFSTTAGTLDRLAVTSDASGSATSTLRTSTQAVVTASVGAQGTTTGGTTGGTGTTGSTAGQASGTVTVAVASAPTLVITPPTTLPVLGLPASFTFAVTVPATNGSPVRSVTVNWGDGTTQELGAVTGNSVISHVFHAINVYQITGTLVDGFGNIVSVTTSVTVVPAPLTLIITAPASPSAGLPASFTIVPGVPANSGDSVKSVQILWGDGTAAQELGAISSSTVVTHVFREKGNYTITGTVTDVAGNSVTVYTAVTVIPVPNPTINITPSVPTIHSTTTNVSFQIQVTTPSGVAIQDASIDFGDSHTDSLGGLNGTVTKVHGYTGASGTPYTVTVSVTDTLGRTTTGTTSITLP